MDNFTIYHTNLLFIDKQIGKLEEELEIDTSANICIKYTDYRKARINGLRSQQFDSNLQNYRVMGCLECDGRKTDCIGYVLKSKS